MCIITSDICYDYKIIERGNLLMFTINDLRRYCDEKRLNKIEKGFRNE